MIDKFEGEHAFLSNFYPTRLAVFGIVYQNSEAAFQAFKTLDIPTRKNVFSKATAKEAKKLGRELKLRTDWDFVKLSDMEYVVECKFYQNPELLQKLIDTGDEELVEGNTWHDNFWGNCTCEKCKDIPGENHLGKILMDIRKKYKNQGGNDHDQ